MIAKLLLEEIAQKSIESGEVVVEEDGAMTAIATDIGGFGIRQDGDDIFYITYTPANMITKDDVFDGNERMKRWYANFLKNRRDEKGYVEVVLFNQTLNFEEAYKLSEYILSKIIKKEDRAHMSLN